MRAIQFQTEAGVLVLALQMAANVARSLAVQDWIEKHTGGTLADIGIPPVL